MRSLEKVRKLNLHRVIYLSLCYMMLFAAYSSTQLLMTQIYRQLGYYKLGQYCLLGAFVGVLLSSIISNHFHQKTSFKLEMIAGAIAYIALLGCGVFASSCYKFKDSSTTCDAPFVYSLTITLAVVMGICASFFWLAQTTYINACADEQTRENFNAIFFSFLQASQVLSNLIALFVLGEADQFTYYCVLLGFGFVGLFMMCFIKAPIPYHTMHGREFQSEPKKSLGNSLKKFMKTLGDKKYSFVFMGVTFAGVSASFYSTALGTIISSTITSEPTSTINQRTGFVLLVLTIAQILAGFFLRRIADSVSKITLLGITLVVNEAGLLLSFLTYYLKGYEFGFIAGAFWGFGDTGINTMLNIVISSRFNPNPDIYSCYRFLEAAGFILSAVIGIFTLKTDPILYMGSVAALMVSLQILFYWFYPSEDEPKRAKFEPLIKEKPRFKDEEKGFLQKYESLIANPNQLPQEKPRLENQGNKFSHKNSDDINDFTFAT